MEDSFSSNCLTAKCIAGFKQRKPIVSCVLAASNADADSWLVIKSGSVDSIEIIHCLPQYKATLLIIANKVTLAELIYSFRTLRCSVICSRGKGKVPVSPFGSNNNLLYSFIAALLLSATSNNSCL